MRDIDAAVLRGNSCELHQFIGCRKPVRYVLKRRAEPQCSLLHRLCHEPLHLRQFHRAGGTFVFAQNVLPNTAGANKCPNVDRRMPAFFESLEVIGQASPINGDMVMACRTGEIFSDDPVIDRCNGSSFACDLGRHTLKGLAGSRLSTRILNSDCPSMSIKPGATTRFV